MQKKLVLFYRGAKEGWRNAAQAKHSHRINAFDSLIKYVFGYDANTFQAMPVFCQLLINLPH